MNHTPAFVMRDAVLWRTPKAGTPTDANSLAKLRDYEDNPMETTHVVDYRRSLCPIPISTRYTADELKQLDATAKQCKMSRAELIHARSLGKIVTTHELADWAEAELANNSSRKARRGSRAA